MRLTTTLAALTLAISLAATAPAVCAQVGSDLKSAGHETADATKTGAHKTAHGTKKVYHKTAHGTSVAAHKTAHGTKVAAKDTGHAAVKVGHGTENLGDKMVGKPATH